MKSKLISALLSVVAAFSLWLYVITVVSPDSEATFDVYVKVDNENVLKEKGLMLNPNQKSSVHLKLSGNLPQRDSLCLAIDHTNHIAIVLIHDCFRRC